MTTDRRTRRAELELRADPADVARQTTLAVERLRGGDVQGALDLVARWPQAVDQGAAEVRAEVWERAIGAFADVATTWPPLPQTGAIEDPREVRLVDVGGTPASAILTAGPTTSVLRLSDGAPSWSADDRFDDAVLGGGRAVLLRSADWSCVVVDLATGASHSLPPLAPADMFQGLAASPEGDLLLLHYVSEALFEAHHEASLSPETFGDPDDHELPNLTHVFRLPEGGELLRLSGALRDVDWRRRQALLDTSTSEEQYELVDLSTLTHAPIALDEVAAWRGACPCRRHRSQHPSLDGVTLERGPEGVIVEGLARRYALGALAQSEVAWADDGRSVVGIVPHAHQPGRVRLAVWRVPRSIDAKAVPCQVLSAPRSARPPGSVRSAPGASMDDDAPF